MPTTFRPYQPDQLLMMPPALQDWLPEGHLAHHVSDLVDGMDLGVFYAPYEGALSGFGAQASGGCGVPGAGGGQLSFAPDAVRVSPASSG